MDPEMSASENTIDIHSHLANIGIDTFDYRLPQEEKKMPRDVSYLKTKIGLIRN